MPSKSRSYSALITAAPRVGLINVERPEFVCWDFDEYARIPAAAREDGPEWYAAVCLAGEAGLRAGEIRALRWKEDVDMIAGTITVNQQIRQGMLGTPKLRDSRCALRREPVDVHALDGAQADRRDDAVRESRLRIGASCRKNAWHPERARPIPIDESS